MLTWSTLPTSTNLIKTWHQMFRGKVYWGTCIFQTLLYEAYVDDKLAQNNTIVTTSDDPCKIKVVQVQHQRLCGGAPSTAGE